MANTQIKSNKNGLNTHFHFSQGCCVGDGGQSMTDGLNLQTPSAKVSKPFDHSWDGLILEI